MLHTRYVNNRMVSQFPRLWLSLFITAVRLNPGPSTGHGRKNLSLLKALWLCGADMWLDVA